MRNRERPDRIGHAKRDIGPARHAALQKAENRSGRLRIVQVNHRAASGAARRQAPEEDRLHSRQVQDVDASSSHQRDQVADRPRIVFPPVQKGHLDSGVA